MNAKTAANVCVSNRKKLSSAYFFGAGGSADLEQALANLGSLKRAFLVSNSTRLLTFVPAHLRCGFDDLGFADVPVDFGGVVARVVDTLKDRPRNLVIVVDMSWGLDTVSATANFENWGIACDHLTRESERHVVSLYNRQLLIEDQILSALRGHSHFLAPSGVYDNPYWLPPSYLQGASIADQASFLLRRVVPDYADSHQVRSAPDLAATGADPDWIASPRRISPLHEAGQRWKIRCFGRLRIYRADSSLIDWQTAGSAPRKVKAVFAYLLHNRERGADAEHVADLIWPEAADPNTARNRLHHTITMLRKSLGGKDTVIRHGNYYRLNPPEGSWIDISIFEQLCRRSVTLHGNDQYDEALTCLRAADRLYTGDLFEDIPLQYVDNETEDWCLPQRRWLRDMALKVQRDMGAILRTQGEYRQALEHCQKAIAMEPTCDIAHQEAMEIFYAENRQDAIARQYKQYLEALHALGVEDQSGDVKRTFQRLSQAQ